MALGEKDHLALRLVSLRKDQRLNETIDEAIKFYLSNTGGYELRISEGKTETDK